MHEDPTKQKLLFVEYRDGHPFHVETGSKHGGMDYVDFEWCKRDRTRYYHVSGCGPASGAGALSGFVSKPKPGEVRIWVAPGVPLATTGLKPRALSRAAAERMGYSFFARRPRPFARAVEDETSYCETCDDRLPAGALCEHLGLCYDCGDDYSTPAGCLKHRWHDREPAQVELPCLVKRPAPVYCRTTVGIWSRYLDRRDREARREVAS